MLAKRPTSLRVFGCLPVTARGAARRQASEKPRRRKPRGEYAPAAVSVYGDLRRGSARLGRSRTELPAKDNSYFPSAVDEKRVAPQEKVHQVYLAWRDASLPDGLSWRAAGNQAFLEAIKTRD